MYAVRSRIDGLWRGDAGPKRTQLEVVSTEEAADVMAKLGDPKSHALVLLAQHFGMRFEKVSLFPPHYDVDAGRMRRIKRGSKGDRHRGAAANINPCENPCCGQVRLPRGPEHIVQGVERPKVQETPRGGLLAKREDGFPRPAANVRGVGDRPAGGKRAHRR